MIMEFSSEDEYQSWCDEDPYYRLVLNTKRNGYDNRSTCIHLASCDSIRQTSKPGGFTQGDYEKIGSLEVKELEDWLNDRRSQKRLLEIEVRQHSCTRRRLASAKNIGIVSKLKKLYRNLIENRKSVICDWHDSYRSFHDEARIIRIKIQGGYRLHHVNDEPFLKKLLYETVNGIASVGQSSWKEDDYHTFIRSEEFMLSLEALILDPNRENWINLRDEWYAQKGYNNPARVNRVATACTLEVSTTVDPSKFDKVFSWLLREQIIPEYKEKEENDWYSKNVFLMNILKNEFKNELRNNTTDEFYLSQFIWELHQHLSKEIRSKGDLQRLNVILYGPPGTGKTYSTTRKCIEICDGNADTKNEDELRERFRKLRDEEWRVEFVTFHQSYGYEEFVEGLRPETLAEEPAESGNQSSAADLAAHPPMTSTVSGGFRLKPVDGVLKRIARRARRDSERPYVLVIDEINRANISKVLGELVTLLEDDKREGAENEVSVVLPYSKESFTLPGNLYILGTMNTADRSIALLDTALRRRFEFVEMPPEPERLGEIGGVDLPSLLRIINERLEYLIDRDHLIGHAWLMGCKDLDDVGSMMRNKIIPLLVEYFYDDWNKVSAVLGGGNHFITQKKLDPPPGLEGDGGEDRYRWTVNEPPYSKQAYENLIKPSSQRESGV